MSYSGHPSVCGGDISLWTLFHHPSGGGCHQRSVNDAAHIAGCGPASLTHRGRGLAISAALLTSFIFRSHSIITVLSVWLPLVSLHPFYDEYSICLPVKRGVTRPALLTPCGFYWASSPPVRLHFAPRSKWRPRWRLLFDCVTVDHTFVPTVCYIPGILKLTHVLGRQQALYLRHSTSSHCTVHWIVLFSIP